MVVLFYFIRLLPKEIGYSIYKRDTNDVIKVASTYLLSDNIHKGTKSNYSSFNESAGLAIAACADLIPTVKEATIKAPKPATTNTIMPVLIR